MLHSTSGIAELDVGTSIELATAALELSANDLMENSTENGVLEIGGNLVMKIFEVIFCLLFFSMT